MKIGYFTDGFPYKDPLTGETLSSYIGGGVGEVVFNLSIQMAKKGHTVYIFSKAVGEDSSIIHYDNISVIRYKSRFKISNVLLSPDILYLPLFSGIKLDIAHAHMGVISGSIAGYLYSRWQKTPLLITHHGDILATYGGVIQRLALNVSDYLFEILLRKCDRIIALSKEHIDGSKHLGKFKSKISIIPNGINLNSFEFDNSKREIKESLYLPVNKKIILFVGNLTPRKGPHVLLKAMNIVKNEYPNSHLVLIGSGDFKRDLSDISKNLKLEENITFTGFVPDDQKVKYYKAADIFVLPSFMEAYPLSLLEASAAGLPLVVSELECLKAIVSDGINGLISATGDENDLANKLLFLLNNEEACEEMGRQARRHISHLSWESVAFETEKLYIDLIKRKNGEYL